MGVEKASERSEIREMSCLRVCVFFLVAKVCVLNLGNMGPGLFYSLLNYILDNDES